jgi:hypothetical protein
VRTPAKRLRLLAARRRSLRVAVAAARVAWRQIEEHCLEHDPALIELVLCVGLLMDHVLERVTELEDDAVDDDFLGVEEAYT